MGVGAKAKTNKRNKTKTTEETIGTNMIKMNKRMEAVTALPLKRCR